MAEVSPPPKRGLRRPGELPPERYEVTNHAAGKLQRLGVPYWAVTTVLRGGHWMPAGGGCRRYTLAPEVRAAGVPPAMRAWAGLNVIADPQNQCVVTVYDGDTPPERERERERPPRGGNRGGARDGQLRIYPPQSGPGSPSRAHSGGRTPETPAAASGGPGGTAAKTAAAGGEGGGSQRPGKDARSSAPPPHPLHHAAPGGDAPAGGAAAALAAALALGGMGLCWLIYTLLS
jgi:hypothetical protein